MKAHCISCGKEFDLNRVNYTCPDCGPLAGTLDITYDYSGASLPQDIRTLFDFTGLLPVDGLRFGTPLRVGNTPLYSFASFAKQHNIRDFLFKDDSLQPSLSLKDRASAVNLAHARQHGYEIIATASTGNAAASLACLSASQNMTCVIFVPRSIPEAKLAQLKIFGAKIVMVDGTYDDAFDLCSKVCTELNWYNRSTAINPVNIEGKKTVLLEIFLQMKRSLPDVIFVPVGDGSIFSAVYKGCFDLQQMGLIDKIPKLVACQASGSSAIFRAFQKGLTIPEAVEANTLADSISVDLPRDGVKALRAIRECKGYALSIPDEAILSGISGLAREFGIFVEPSSACAFAGFLQASNNNMIEANTSALVLLTGAGLKDLKSANRATASAEIFKTGLDAKNSINNIKKFVTQ